MRRIFVVFVLCLGSCGQVQIPVEKPDLPRAKDIPIAGRNGTSPDRFKAVSWGTFEGGYRNNEREIFIVTDSDTGKEYLAITGCGVTEIIREERGSGENRNVVDREE